MAREDPIVGCGHEWLPWSQIIRFATTSLGVTLASGSYPRQSSAIGMLKGHNLTILEDIRQQVANGKTTALDWYLRRSTGFDATDSRDKVYALLGMARDIDRTNLIPDYDDLNLQRHLNARVVQHFLVTDGCLNILSWYRNPKRYLSRFDGPFSLIADQRYHPHANTWPSWVPSFDGKTDFGHVILKVETPLLNDNDWYRASGARRAYGSVSNNLQVLIAEGILFDIVESTIKPCVNPLAYLDHLIRVGSLFTSTLDSNPLYRRDYFISRCRSFFGDHYLDHFGQLKTTLFLNRLGADWLTLVTGRTVAPGRDHQPSTYGSDAPTPGPSDAPPVPRRSFSEMYEVLVKGKPVPANFAPLSVAGDSATSGGAEWDRILIQLFAYEGADREQLLLLEYTRPFWKQCRPTMANRTAFTTRAGLVGLGPLDTNEGDVVAILFGADVPFILRPSSPFPEMGAHQGSQESRWKKRYSLMGDCYVQSIMAGELIDLLDQFGWENMNGIEAGDFQID